ncbi:MAG: glycosyltransferase family 2 protein [Saprospiraceae bacterium]|nr:glycosyltransferase family 2 protein [Saprospiraceae bacterium]
MFYLLLPFLLVAFSSLVKRTIKSNRQQATDFGIIITAYKNVHIAEGLVQSILKQSYANHHIYLVADQCDVTNFGLQNEQLTLLKPDPPLNLKVKSIIYAVEQFVRAHDYIIVFDADNLAHPNFLAEINAYVNAGYSAIQGQRTAKNLDTLMAGADALGEFYKNYVDRYAPYLLGSSAVISGSGMAIARDLYLAYLNSPEIEKGKELGKKMLQEDKILQNFILSSRQRIVYAWDAVLYDEKVSTPNAVETQRSRWLYSYFQNFPNALALIAKGLLGWNWNQLLFGIITAGLPMFILLGLSGGAFLVGIFIAPWMALLILMAMFVFVSNIFLTLYLSKAPAPVWNAAKGAPYFVFKQLTALLKMGNPQKNFKPTEHQHHVTIDELIKPSDKV